MNRRTILMRGGLTLGGALLPSGCYSQLRANTAANNALGPARRFSHAWLKARAERLARAAHRPPPRPHPEVVASLDYDAMQHVRFRADKTLFAEAPMAAPVQLHPLSEYNTSPVTIFVVDGGQARELRYRPDYFEVEEPVGVLPEDLGFGGFRLMYREGPPRDWLSFMGASYFRSAGPLDQYGLSARGIAIGTGGAEPEEFPRFSEFYLAPGDEDADLAIYALLEGPSVTGAYAFRVKQGRPVKTHVRATLFPRRAIPQLGIAPLTSMFWFSETNHEAGTDWRPEVHDSDGLLIHTGEGERLWRPLLNPSRLKTSSFADRSPRGFGLMQRDREFDHYQDDGIFYERRPSLWIEPEGDWGEGSVRLVEIPTDDEIYDNVAAFWTPAQTPPPLEPFELRYKALWMVTEPDAGDIARVHFTRIGTAGVPGQQPRPPGGVKFVIDFAGAAVEGRGRDEGIEPVVSARGGRVDAAYAHPVVGTERFRAVFDFYPEAEEVDLRCFLQLGESALSETWTLSFDRADLLRLRGRTRTA